MADQTHVLNRPLVLTEIPGNIKLPQGTRLTVILSSGMLHDVIAITPTGQRYEFKSQHIVNLIKTPWVDPVATDVSAGLLLAAPAPVVTKEPENPFTIGDVTSIEAGVNDDTLPPMDVTGSSTQVMLKTSVTETVVTEFAAPLDPQDAITTIAAPLDTQDAITTIAAPQDIEVPIEAPIEVPIESESSEDAKVKGRPGRKSSK